MLLLILVGVLNTEKTFPFALYFIILETTTSFKVMKNQLDNLFFHNYFQLKIIYENFAKRQILAIIRKKIEH